MKKIKRLAQAILGNKYVTFIIDYTSIVILWLASLNRLFTYIFHIFSFLTFNREQQAVLKGRYLFLKSKYGNEKAISYVRRNIHRIEKGLIMQPRKDVFAEGYVYATIDKIRKMVEEDAGLLDTTLLQWSHDVLEEYFGRVKQTPKVIKAKEAYDSIEWDNLLEHEEKYKPYSHSDIKKSDVTIDDMLALALQRRSVRWFQDKRVEKEKIDKAMEVANLSPTGCNRQPYKFHIYQQRESARIVADIPFGAGGYAKNVPAVAALVGQQDYYFSARDRHTIYIDTSLAAMSFMYALETQGISSCVINWPDFELLESKLEKKLDLERHERAIMFIAFGYAAPDGEIAYSKKKSLDEIREYRYV